jgi:hypothetical protein
MHAFFITYRNHTSPSVVLNILIRKYEDYKRQGEVWPRILTILESWIKFHYTRDFRSDRLLRMQLWKFIDSSFNQRIAQELRMWRTMAKSRQNSTPDVKSRCQDVLKDMAQMELNGLGNSTPKGHAFHDFMSMHPPEIARQLTLIEFDLFSRIDPFHCLDIRNK